MRILMYHGVEPELDANDHKRSLTIDAQTFDGQVAELARRWRALDLDEARAVLTGRAPAPDRAVHVTFDDGFRNNLVAAEILARHRVPWTLFVAVDAVLDGYTPWYVRLADAVAASGRRVIWRDREYDLATLAGATAFTAAVKREVLSVPFAQHLLVLEQALEGAGIRAPDDTRWPFLSPEELRQLVVAGVGIGNHSATHPDLRRCSDAELVTEVTRARDRLAAFTGRDIRTFSYPDGRSDARVRSQVGRSHDVAMAVWTGAAQQTPLRVRRFEAGRSVEQLRSVLADDYPIRFGLRRARWRVRSVARDAAATAARLVGTASRRSGHT